jgi:hypothetical protein
MAPVAATADQNPHPHANGGRNVSEVLVGLASAAAGFASGLLVPWVKWRIEKRQEQHKYRGDTIKGWRAAIEAEEYDVTDARSHFLNSAHYSSLRAHMVPEAIQTIEALRTVYVAGARGGHVRNQVLLDEVSRLEKEWGLV